MTSSMLRRQLKNLVQNYSEAEVKVREATSNDPWGPSSTQMADISDLTYNVVACNEIMTMLWKRLKDDRNWRHIHKSLTLLEYLLKTGDERVLLKMKDNVYIVKALTEYRFVEKDGKDQGVNVRDKAKVVLVLMEDDDKLKEERDFAFKTREKTSKGSAASSTDTLKDPNYKPVFVAGATGLPSLTNIPSVADLAASFEKKKEERIKQEVQKKEQARRARMTDDELQWEDAGKGGEVQGEAWGEEQSEEETDAWGAPIKPKEAEGPWGTPDRPETTDTEMAAEGADGWGPQKNGEDPFEESEDPFAAEEEVKFTEEDSTDPFYTHKERSPEDKPKAFTPTEEDAFAAKKDDPFSSSKDDPFKTNKEDPFKTKAEDPFGAPKDDPFASAKSEDPFGARKDDPFTAAKSEDPFGAPKDDPFTAAKSEDPFGIPKDDSFTAAKSEDPFGVPKDDSFTAAKSEDPFGIPKDDSFTAAKTEDPFRTPKDDSFTAAKSEDPFGAPKDDSFTSAKSDPFGAPQEDPFGMAKNDPFTSTKEEPKSPPPKDDPFSAPSKSAEDPFGTSTSPTGGDAFGIPVSPPSDDPFTTVAADTDPFAAPTSPPKEDPFNAQTSSPATGDPFAASSAQPKNNAADPFGAPSASSPQDGAAAWGEPASPPPAAAADAWGVASPAQETRPADPWGDGASAMSPVSDADPFGDTTKPDNDPWGAPATAPANTDDAWGSSAPDSASSPSDPFGSKGDPWGAPSSTASTGQRSGKEEAIYKKTASFLGSAGASLVDLDDLFLSLPKRSSAAFIASAAGQSQATGALNAPSPAPFPQSSTSSVCHFGSDVSSSYSAFGAAPSLSRLRLNFGQRGPAQTQVWPSGPQTIFGVQTSQPRPVFGDWTGLQQTGPSPPMASVSNPLFQCNSEAHSNYNPFL